MCSDPLKSDMIQAEIIKLFFLSARSKYGNQQMHKSFDRSLNLQCLPKKLNTFKIVSNISSGKTHTQRHNIALQVICRNVLCFLTCQYIYIYCNFFFFYSVSIFQYFAALALVKMSSLIEAVIWSQTAFIDLTSAAFTTSATVGGCLNLKSQRFSTCSLQELRAEGESLEVLKQQILSEMRNIKSSIFAHHIWAFLCLRCE